MPSLPRYRQRSVQSSPTLSDAGQRHAGCPRNAPEVRSVSHRVPLTACPRRSGDVCDEQANDDALIDGFRLLSAYRTSLGEKLWIITEAADDSGHRAATTILLPSEY